MQDYVPAGDPVTLADDFDATLLRADTPA